MKRRIVVTSILSMVLLSGSVLAVNPVSWISGTAGPASWTVNPATPTTADTLTFAGPLAKNYSNSCVAESYLGGTPQLTIDTTNKNIDLWFQGPAPDTCVLIYSPVCGLQGVFGPLSAGKWTFRCTTLGVSVAFTVTGTGGGGGVIYVDHNSPGPVRDGTTWAKAFTYLQDALAIPGTNEIRMADGTYLPDQGAHLTAGDRTATFNVQNGTIIKGGYAGYGASNPDARDINAYRTILSGDLRGNDLWNILNKSDNSYHVVTVSGDAKLDGLTIQGGQADGHYPHFYGGGIYAVGGDLIVSRCTIRANTALYGGGVGALVSSTYFGNCNISGNRAYMFGGGVYNEDGGATLVNCLMTGNSGGSSGVGGGSAISNIGGSAAYVSIGDCTIADNTGPDQPGIVVLNYSLAGAVSAVTIYNSILYDNGVNGSIWTNDTAQVAANYSIVQGGWSTGSGNLNADPLFVQRGSWSIEGEWIDTGSNYGVQSGSPAIDSGKTSLLSADLADVDGDANTAEIIPIDLAGANRVQGAAVDMGAYENTVTWVHVTDIPVTYLAHGVTVPIPLSGSAIISGQTDARSELKVEIVPTSIAGGTWTASFSPNPGYVGPGSFTATVVVQGSNVAVQLLTSGVEYQLALVSIYARPVSH